MSLKIDDMIVELLKVIDLDIEKKYCEDSKFAESYRTELQKRALKGVG